MRIHRPSTLEEVQEIVAAARQVRAVGSRHSFNEIADAEEQVALSALPADVVLDRAAATVSFGGRQRNLATAVAALEMVTSSGDVVTAARGSPDFDGLVVGLGALGVVTRLTLDVEPAYDVRQRVFEGLAWDMLFEHFDEITASGYSVSVLTRWGRRWIRCGSGAA